MAQAQYLKVIERNYGFSNLGAKNVSWPPGYLCLEDIYILLLVQHDRSESIFEKIRYMKELSSQLLVKYTIF